MRLGAPLTMSLVAHVAVGVMTVMALPYVDEQYEPPEVIPVDVILGDVPEWEPPAGETAPPQPNLKPPRPDEPEPEEASPSPSEDAADETVLATTMEDAPLEGAEETIITPEPREEDGPQEPEPVESLADDSAEVEEEPEEANLPPPVPRVKPPPPRQQRLDSLRDLLDERTRETQASTPRFRPQAVPNSASSGGASTVADFQKVVQSRMRNCWRASIDAPDPERLVVEVRLEIQRDGYLAGPPEVLNENRIRLSGDPFWEVARLRARQAAIECEPYPPPPEPYEDNRFVTLNFRP